MNVTQFDQTIKILFKKELLEGDFEDDFGFTFRSNNIISKIGYCTNLSLETIELAAKNKVDLLITHHDAWDFLYGLKEACLKKLENYQITHFWIHGPLDYVEFGTCTSLMNAIGIHTIQTYSYYDEGDYPGIGEFEHPLKFDELVEKMRSKLNEPVRAWQNNEKEIKRVGILTGAGHSTDHIRRAQDAGIDTYITGEATLYTIQYAQFSGINLIVGSHTFTEIFGVESLVDKIKALHPDLAIVRLEEDHFELNHG